MATIYQVSELAGVSLATVSRVMNDSARVSPKTRQKVLSAMQELDYQPNSIAQSLASRRSNCIGVLVSELHGPIFGALMSSIEEVLRKAGKFVIFAVGHSDEQKEKEGVNFLISRNCDALILHLEATSDDDLMNFRDSATPFVIINRDVPGLMDRSISLNNEQGGYLATHHLIKQGHRNIAYISGPLDWADANARLAGHKRALSESGLAFDDRLMIPGNYLVPGGEEAMKQLFEKDLNFSAVVCANDEMAVGAMDVIRKKGLRIPGDISVVGFDNVRWAPFLSPKLTSVNNPIRDMGRMAADWVMKHVYDEETLEVQTVFEPTLIERESSGPVA
jgi:LacI family transcriptional regulator